MSDTFLTCLDFTRKEEGGYTADPRDSGNWSTGLVGQGRLIGSNMGVSAPTLIAWIGRDESAAVDSSTMRALGESTYQAIARARYWRSLSCDDLSPPIAMMVFDYGWNAGVSKSSRLLQTVLGLSGQAVDGDLGPKTVQRASTPNWHLVTGGLDSVSVKALQKLCALSPDGIAGPKTIDALQTCPSLWPLGVALKLAQSQRASYESLPTFRTFGEGWLARTSRRLDLASELASRVTT